MARVLVLDVIGNTGVYEAECNDIHDFYKHLKCDCFDIATRKIGGKYFDCFVDDTGLFVEHPIPSVLDDELKPMLVGNVVIANHDAEGNTTSLTNEDITLIKDNVINVANLDAEPIKAWKVITAEF